jgi:glycosyltransferase involved in cell wall biosynthesis
VIPCLNESMTIVEAVGNAREAFASRPGSVEVIMADNGLTVGSAELAHTAGACVVLAAERGYGAALQTGLAAAQAADIVYADADLTYGLPGGATATYHPPRPPCQYGGWYTPVR